MGRFVIPLLTLATVLVVVGSGSAEVIDVETEDLAQLLGRGVPVVDVRTPAEWQQTGVVAGSRLHTFFDEQGRYDLRSWMAEMSVIAGPDDPVVLICRSGNRSLTIANFLDRQAGYRRVYNVRQGIRGWIRDGKPTQRPEAGSS